MSAMYIRDLTGVAGIHAQIAREALGIGVHVPVVSVGWLGTFWPHSTGETVPAFRERLVELCEAPPILHRGFCRCRQGLCKLMISSEDGVGEIVVNGTRRAFLAPSLVGHYVMRHRYLPPREFIDAVLASEGNRNPGTSLT